MRGLTIIVTGPDPVRYDAALAIAAAHAALGGSTRIHLHADAIALLQTPPALAVDARALGVRWSACQSGMADAAIDARDHPEIEASGLVALLARLGDDRLVSL